MHPKIPLDSQKIENINRTIAQAEKTTSARIVPVVAYRSARYDRAEDLVGLWAAALALTLILAFFLEVPFGTAVRSEEGVWRMGLLPVLGIITAGFLCGALLLKQIGWVRRLFVPPSQFRANTLARAQEVRDTHRSADSRDGLVLVFVSIYEQAACILAGDEILAKLDRQKVEGLAHDLGKSPKDGQLDLALCQTVTALANLLAPLYPPARQETPRHELLEVL